MLTFKLYAHLSLSLYRNSVGNARKVMSCVFVDSDIDNESLEVGRGKFAVPPPFLFIGLKKT